MICLLIAGAVYALALTVKPVREALAFLEIISYPLKSGTALACRLNIESFGTSPAGLRHAALAQ
jgi:hypothetical protein